MPNELKVKFLQEELTLSYVCDCEDRLKSRIPIFILWFDSINCVHTLKFDDVSSRNDSQTIALSVIEFLGETKLLN